MLQFMNMDTFKHLLNSPSEARVRNAVIGEILRDNISPDLEKCLLTYDKIEHHVEELYRKNRNEDALLDRAIQYFKEGKIILLDGELTSFDQYKIPPFLLFIPINKKLLFNINGMKKATWKKTGHDEYEYKFSNPLVELKFMLVTAMIMYEILINDRYKDIINDNKLMTTITQIYVDFFKKAIGRLGSDIDPVDTDKVNYIISKFFYIHSLQVPENEADKIVSKMYGYADYEISDIRLDEDNIDYTSLEKFVPTMTKLFYKKEIQFVNLVNSWANSFGSSIFVEVEYFPALLTHLMVLINGVDFVNQRYDLKSRKNLIYQRLYTILK